MDLRASAMRGVKWTSIGTVVTSLFQFLQNVVFARLLTPEDFGLMAIITLILGIGLGLLDLGLSTAIIQKKEISSSQYSTLYWLNIMMGIFLFGIFNALAAYIAQFFELESSFFPYLRASTLCFLIIPWGLQFNALLVKQLKFDLINRINIGNAIGTFLLGLILAVKGFGLWALVGAYLFNASFQSIMSVLYGWKYAQIKPYINLDGVSDLLRFGLYDAGTSFVRFFSGNIDKLLIGKLLGAHALGLYTLAWNLVLFPLKKINPVLTQVAFPVFSRIQFEAERLGRYYYQLVLALMSINIPLLLGLAFFSEDFLALVYGSQWSEGATTLSLLCMVGLLKCFAEPGEKLMLAKGRADVTFYLNTAWGLGAAIFIGLFLWLNPSIEGVAWGQIAAGVLVGWFWHYLVARVGTVNYRKLLKRLSGLMLFILPLWGLRLVFAHWLDDITWMWFALQLLIATIIYFLIIYYFYRALFVLTKKFLKG